MKRQFLLIFFCITPHHAQAIGDEAPAPMKRCVSAPPDMSKTPEEQKELDALGNRWKKNYRLSSPMCHPPTSFPVLRRAPRMLSFQ